MSTRNIGEDPMYARNQQKVHKVLVTFYLPTLIWFVQEVPNEGFFEQGAMTDVAVVETRSKDYSPPKTSDTRLEMLPKVHKNWDSKRSNPNAGESEFFLPDVEDAVEALGIDGDAQPIQSPTAGDMHIDDCPGVIEKQQLIKAAEMLAGQGDYLRFAREADIREYQIDIIEANYKMDVREASWKTLVKWQQLKGEKNASLLNFVKILHRIGRVDIVDEISAPRLQGK
ncbi:hypothetical protein ScPMuIL_010121 [Solemya velum]